jgi:hypothetical protein
MRPINMGSTGTPSENVNVKIPVITQTMPEITKAALGNFPKNQKDA